MNNTLFDTVFALPQSNPDIPVSDAALCPGNVPLTLLPVRLETRFFRLPGNVPNDDRELRVRIYPDKIHVDSHQPELTTEERNSGTQYWQLEWRAGVAAGSDMAARTDAWSTLANRFGAPRAAWIARVLQPTNLAQRPAAAVPGGQAPAVLPLFPILAPVGVGGESAWRHAPQARLLPDRWTAVLHAGGKVALSVTGRDIQRPLAVGPDPQAAEPDAATTAAILAGDQLALDEGMRWLVDFNAAEALGMGLRIAVPQAIMMAGIDSLLVFGVATSLDPVSTASQMADLLDAHHYTDGLEFMRYGTSTNNTDDRRAGYNSEDRHQARSFGNEVMADLAHVPNADRVGAALGLPAARVLPTLGRIGQASQNHELDARSMNTALWQIGWGYFLSNMMGAETGLTTASVDWAHGHFLNHVRAGGPFPALRCGAQPYGILPVTSLDLWEQGANAEVTPIAEEIWLKEMLRKLRDKVWRPVVKQVARVGLRQATATKPADPDADLADVMRTDGVSHQILTRRVLGRHFLEHLHAIGAQDFSAIAQSQDTISARLVDLLGLPSLPAKRPHLAHAFFEPSSWPVTVPLVQSGEVSPWQMLARPNYIGTLLATRSIDALIKLRPDPAATDPNTNLLQVLLRHAMLREIANAAARIAVTLTDKKRDLATLLRDLELVDLVDLPAVNFTLKSPPGTEHWKRQLALPVSDNNTQTIGAFLEGLTRFTLPTTVAALGEFRTSLARLQGLDSESLQHLMLSTLDLSSHRLDAWITSFATQRLTKMGSNGTAGQCVGAYGWVENLRPALDSSPVPPVSMPSGEQAPLFNLAKDSGFIHAPSLSHASTAALLRNAHLGPTGIAQADGPFAIDLSSRRVREASRLLDGVRQGQPLGALLGYRFERRLHEIELDRCIAPLRALAPLMVRKRENNALPTEALAANNVVDALLLLRRRHDEGPQLLTQVLQSADIGFVEGELSALRDAVDGLSDALTAEAAYQMVRGNTSRMASTLSAIAQGDALPPELEVARMPRTGNAVTHRLLVLIGNRTNAAAGWAATNSAAVSNCERMLNAWVSRLLSDGRQVRCTVERLDEASGAVAETHAFPLSELGLTALGFVYGVEPAGEAGSPGSSSCTVEQLVLYQAQRRAAGFGAQTQLRVQHARPTDLAAGETTLFDMLEQARAIRRLLESARSARPDDLCPPERTSLGTIDLADLEARVVRGENGLNAAHKGLLATVAAGSVMLAEDLRTGMLLLGAFGIPLGVPSVAVGDTPETRSTLLRQAAALLKTSAARLAQGAALRAQAAAANPRARCEQLLERGRVAFGAKFVMLPSFTCDAAGAAELKNALAASTQQQGGDALAAHTWFTRSARVRDTVSRLGACLRGAEVFGAPDRLALSVAQLPFDSKERWVGLPPLPGTELAQSKLSVVVQSPVAIDTAQPLWGLFVDEWVEVVPSKTETTALAFQFDPPNSFAPQNILVAVPPVPGAPWTAETLRSVLMETLDLAKLRAVDPSLLGAAAQYLPALYVPFNAADDAVSTDFTALTA